MNSTTSNATKSVTVITAVFVLFVGVIGAMLKGFQDGALHQPVNIQIAEGPMVIAK
ncbi:MAG: hypothetical protein AAGA18_14980 [Verrucomicrobiota bacterium]